MKQTIVGFALMIGTAFLLAYTPTVNKTYKFEFNQQQLEAVWFVVDNSSAPHDQVKQVEALIQQQYRLQLDTVKVDSTGIRKKLEPKKK